MRDDVAFGPQNLDPFPEQINALVQEALLTAGVLAMQPRLMIDDEPSASLDIRSRRRLIDYLQGAPETQLIASLDLEFVLEVCDRVVLLDMAA